MCRVVNAAERALLFSSANVDCDHMVKVRELRERKARRVFLWTKYNDAEDNLC